MNEMHTYMGLVRNPADATLIFEACRQGKLPRIQRRLSDRERNAIRSGSIFVWDEKEAGMRRWTDGKSWSASRVSGSFLTYREMEGKRAVSDLPLLSGRGPGHSGDESDGDQDPHDNQKYEMTESYKYKVDGLIKQSFSITTSEDQKLHLISYFGRTYPNNAHLRQPTQDPALMHIQIPRGLYPESTLELAQSPSLGRSDDGRFPPPHNAGPIAPAPSPGHPQSGPSFATPHPMSSTYHEPSWDYRGGPNGRPPREIRPAVYDGREHGHDYHANGPSYLQSQAHHPQQQQSGPQQHHNNHHHPMQHTPLQNHHPGQQMPQHSNAPQQQQHRHSLSQNGHPQSQAHTPTQMFHPHPYPQSPITESSQNQNKPVPGYRSGPAPPSSTQTHNYTYQPMQEHRPLPPPPPYTAPMESHPSNMHSHDPQRRQSLPRMNDTMRRSSAASFQTPSRPLSHEPPSSSSQDPLSNSAGQQIVIPDIHMANTQEFHNKAPASDIPPDKLGRWAEDLRALDQLKKTMKL